MNKPRAAAFLEIQRKRRQKRRENEIDILHYLADELITMVRTPISDTDRDGNATAGP